MKKKSFIFFVFLFVICLLSCKSKDDGTLTVYAYDSFCGSWGAGNEIVKEFERETSIKVNLVGCGSAVQMYSRLLLEGRTDADVMIGFSDSMNVDTSYFYGWEPECYDNLIEYDEDGLIPFDYGYYSFLLNENCVSDNIPLCLDDLLKPEFEKKFILIDPRTSSVGLGLLQWTVCSMGEERAMQWWKTACRNALTVCDSWSSAYGLFLEGEAPLVISYTTGPVYHILNNDGNSVRALEFSDGHIRTTEYLAITESSDKKEEAKRFCEFVLTKAQNRIATVNTMFPANNSTILPDAFSSALKPKEIKKEGFSEKQKYYLEKWEETVLK